MSQYTPFESTTPAKVHGMAVQALAGEIIKALEADDKTDGYDLTAGLFGPEFSKLVRRWAAAECAAPVVAQPQDLQLQQDKFGSNVVDAQGKPVAYRGARPAQPVQDATSEALQDCKSHYQAWRSALTNAQHSAKGEADISYWVHEIAAFDRTFKALNAPVEQSAPVPDAVQWYGGVKSDDELFPPAQSVPANQQPIPKALHLEASQISAFLYAGAIECDLDRWDGHVGFVANCAEVALDIASFLKENDGTENPGVIAYELFEPFGKWMAEKGHLAQNSLLDEFKAQYHSWIEQDQASIPRESAS